MRLANRRILAGFVMAVALMVLPAALAEGQFTRLFEDGISLKFLPLYQAH